MLRKVIFNLVLAAAVTFFAGTAHAAFITVVQSGADTYDVIYNADGRNTIGSMDLGLTTSDAVGSFSAEWLSAEGGINFNFNADPATRPADDGACNNNQPCVVVGGFNFGTDTVIPDAVTIARLTIAGLGGASIITTESIGGAGTLFQDSAGVIPNTTEDPLFPTGGTVPEPAALVLVGMSLAGMAFLRRRSA